MELYEDMDTEELRNRIIRELKHNKRELIEIMKVIKENSHILFDSESLDDIQAKSIGEDLNREYDNLIELLDYQYEESEEYIEEERSEDIILFNPDRSQDRNILFPEY